jgi:Concanavalin A-like lectin/glucanases superfamily
MSIIPQTIQRAGVIAVTAFLGLPVAHAIDIAGSLEIALDATNYTNGNPWVNTGALPGNFIPDNTPKRENVWGHEAVLFDGQGDAFRGPIITALAGATTRSVEVWAFQGQIKNEETLVAWGRRGGPDGTNTSFLWGADREWGAHGAWGQPGDLGWNPTPENNNNPGGGVNDLTNVPVGGQWHHLVYTYDPSVGGGTLTIYDNGVQKNTQGGMNLNTLSGYNMVIGAQNNNGGAGPAPGFTTADDVFLSGAIARVRVHSGVLSPTNIQTNYNQEAGEFSAGQTSALLTTGPSHRYTFNNLASGDDGTVVPDIIGGAHGVMRGSGAAPEGTTGINLPGGSPEFAAYVDLPNGLLSTRTNITLETWMTVESTQNWSRVMDFGTTSLGELTGPTVGGYSGTNYVMLSASNGTGSDQRFEHVAGLSENIRADNAQRFGISRDSALTATLGIEQHVVFTFDDAANEWRYYKNGMLMEVISDLTTLLSIPDVNNWLGRSQWSGDSNTDGIYNEFRVYDYALTPGQILGNFQAGPEVINIPEPGCAALVAAAAAVLGVRRRRF